ncbi:hypothetical protein KY349_02660 [Candidatus Woesearchaeota archaeon]|nr:hypothetical protein [Candidatus Woesearchaeota archaeon]
MDDVSKLQKINSVARELMKHGQASSMEEAVQKATQQVESGGVLEQQPMQEQPAEQQPEEAPAPEMQGEEQPQEQEVEVQQAEPEPAPEPAPEMHEEQHSEPVEQPQPEAQSTDVAQRLAEMDNKINGLIAEMTALKDEIRRLKESPVTPPLKPKQAKEGQTQFKQDPAPPPPPKQEGEENKGEGHARSGHYKPGDVSVEKFFYYGNR